MKIYCFYGVGNPTERSYYYAVSDENVEDTCNDLANGTGCTHEHTHEHILETSTPSVPRETPANLVRQHCVKYALRYPF